jgi:hypothetical protein
VRFLGLGVRISLRTDQSTSIRPRRAEEPAFAFFLTDANQLSEKERCFTLSAEQIRLINPNSKTAPVFRSRVDAQLTSKIYKRVPILVEDAKGDAGDLWTFEYMTKMFDMADSSSEFRTAAQLRGAGATVSDNQWIDVEGHTWVPLYEAKMIHHFDHRWATYDGEDSRNATASEKSHCNFEPTPRYWIPKKRALERIATKGWQKSWLMGWRDITNTTNERTVIAAFYPVAAIGHTIRNMFIAHTPKHAAAFVACLSSLPLDYIARQALGGTHLTVEILKQLPVLPPSTYSGAALDFIIPRVLELTYTSHSMAPFAKDLGCDGPPFAWDEERRALLRAELDAWYARAYGLTRDELRYILDPAAVKNAAYPSETFRVLKNNELKRPGKYRTQDLVLEAWDHLEKEDNLNLPIKQPVPMMPNEWAMPTYDKFTVQAQVAAILKRLPGPTDGEKVRLATLCALHPRYLTPLLSPDKRSEWQTRVGEAARNTAAGNVVNFRPQIDVEWRDAHTQLRGMNALIEDFTKDTWAPGSTVTDYFTEGWPDARAEFVLKAMEGIEIQKSISTLPTQIQAWVKRHAA